MTPLQRIQEQFSDQIIETHTFRGDGTAVIQAPSLRAVAQFLKKAPDLSLIDSGSNALLVPRNNSTSFLYFNASNLKLNNKREYLKNFLIFSCLSYPFLFAVDRANIEFLLFIFLYLFVYFDQKKYSIISVVFLSFAIAMKAFPAVFLLLLLSEKKYKEMILAVTLSVFFTFVALLCFKGGVSANLNYMLSGFNVNTLAQLSTSNNVLQRGVSLFTLFKLIFIQTNYIHKIDMVKFLSIYTKIIFSVFIVIGYYVVTIEREFWKKVMVLVSAMLLFPHVSVDYKLLYLFIPLFLFINYPKNDKYDLFYIITFALLLIPKDYFIFPNVISEGVVNDISIAVVLNIVLIFAMMFVIIIDGSVNRSKRLRTYDS